jgi:5-methyltetrahydrofolate--homocysteine methyltransferase
MYLTFRTHNGRSAVPERDGVGSFTTMGSECLNDVKKAIIEQDLGRAVDGTRRCLSSGMAGKDVVDAVAEALKEVGDLFECGEMFLPEVMRSANAAKGALNLVLPALSKEGGEGKEGKGLVAIGSLGPHDIGKTIVSSMLIGGGFRIADLGTSVTPERVEKALREGNADILALSVLLTSDLEKAKEVIAKAKEAKPGIRVMIGGAAMTQKNATAMGSDGYGKDGGEAVKLAMKFMEGISR